MAPHWVYGLIISVMSLISLLPLAEAKLEENFVRISLEPDGNTVSIFSDGKMTVMTSLTDAGEVLECHVIKDNVTITRQLFKEAVVAKRGAEVTFRMLDVDVRRIGRKCKKHVRDVKRKNPDQRTAAEREMLDRMSLDEPLEDTKWCTRSSRSRHLKKLGKKEKLDNCCKAYHTCPESIPPFTFGQGFLNPLPWPMSSCTCASQLHQCLREEGSPEALLFHSLLFSTFRLPCVHFKEEEVCTEYGPWMQKCVTKEKHRIAFRGEIDASL